MAVSYLAFGETVTQRRTVTFPWPHSESVTESNPWPSRSGFWVEAELWRDLTLLLIFCSQIGVHVTDPLTALWCCRQPTLSGFSLPTCKGREIAVSTGPCLWVRSSFHILHSRHTGRHCCCLRHHRQGAPHAEGGVRVGSGRAGRAGSPALSLHPAAMARCSPRSPSDQVDQGADCIRPAAGLAHPGGQGQCGSSGQGLAGTRVTARLPPASGQRDTATGTTEGQRLWALPLPGGEGHRGWARPGAPGGDRSVEARGENKAGRGWGWACSSPTEGHLRDHSQNNDSFRFFW